MCLAIPGQVISVTDDEPLERMGQVEFSGIQKKVSLALVPDAQVGSYVLVHAGFAINVLDEAEALKTLEYLKLIGDLEPADPQ